MQNLSIWQRHLPPRLVGIASDVLLWSFLIFLGFALGDRFVDWLELPFSLGSQTIELYFNDVSQLGLGSPVRWMGVDVGYISSVKPQKGRVLVVAQIKPGTVIIPRGSHFTVEFNGLAGSKSLEIVPPRATKPVVGEVIEGYDIEEPIRMQDVMDTQMLVADAMQRNMKNIEKSLSELNHQYEINAELSDVLSLIAAIDHGVARTDSVIHQIQSELDVRSRNLLKSLSQITEPLLELERHGTPSLNVSLDALEKLNKTLTRLETVHNLIPQANKVQQVKAFSQNFLEGVQKLDRNAAQSGLSQASETLEDCLVSLKSLAETQSEAFGQEGVTPAKTLSPQCLETLRDQATTMFEWSEKLKTF